MATDPSAISDKNLGVVKIRARALSIVRASLPARFFNAYPRAHFVVWQKIAGKYVAFFEAEPDFEASDQALSWARSEVCLFDQGGTVLDLCDVLLSRLPRQLERAECYRAFLLHGSFTGPMPPACPGTDRQHSFPDSPAPASSQAEMSDEPS